MVHGDKKDTLTRDIYGEHLPLRLVYTRYWAYPSSFCTVIIFRRRVVNLFLCLVSCLSFAYYRKRSSNIGKACQNSWTLFSSPGDQGGQDRKQDTCMYLFLNFVFCIVRLYYIKIHNFLFMSRFLLHADCLSLLQKFLQKLTSTYIIWIYKQ